MGKVAYKERVQVATESGTNTAQWEFQEVGEGEFLAFGIDYEHLDMTDGMYSTAIIKLEDGTVKNIPVENIRFIQHSKERG